MLPLEHPDRIHVAFDDHRLVANAGRRLPVTLAHHLGLGELVDCHVDLGDAPGRANAGDKMLTLVASALAVSRVNYICRLASISFAGSPPWPGRVAGQRWSGNWGRQTPG